MTLLYMLESTRGSPNGHDVICYKQGLTYDIPHSLACDFLKREVALELPEEDLFTANEFARIHLSTVEIRQPLSNPAMKGFNANLAAQELELAARNDKLRCRLTGDCHAID